MVVLNNMDNIILDAPGVYDLESNFNEIAEIYGKLNNADYIHFNITLGDNAISKYENTIADVADVLIYQLEE